MGRHTLWVRTSILIFSSVCALCVVLKAQPVAAQTQAPVSITINGHALSLQSGQQPVLEDGTTLVPMRAIFEALGATVIWDAEKNEVTGKRGDQVVALTIGSSQALVNGRPVTLKRPAIILGEVTYVPLRFISEALGDAVTWDGDAQLISISSPPANTPAPPETPKYFAASQLEAAVRNYLHRSSGALSPKELASVDSLFVPNAGIQFLDGIEQLTGLTRLDLSGNEGLDYSLLSRLSLVELKIADAGLTDLTKVPLSKSLRSLDLSGNHITSLKSLSGLPALRDLNLSANRISDIEPLKGLSTLETLDLSDNMITGISAVSSLSGLSRLLLGGNTLAVADASTLALRVTVGERGVLGVSAPASPQILLACVDRGDSITWTLDTHSGSMQVAGGVFRPYITSPTARPTFTWSFWPSDDADCRVTHPSSESLSVVSRNGGYVVDNQAPSLTATIRRPDGTRFGSLAPVENLANLKTLAVDRLYTGDDELIEGLPQLRHLMLATVGKGSSDQPVAQPVQKENSDHLPYRVETFHAVFAGDQGITLQTLLGYAQIFESTLVTEEYKDTGLQPTAHKALFQIYGTRTEWVGAAKDLADAAVGFYAPGTHRVYMDHGRYGAINTILLGHEYLHWLMEEEGKAQAPTWFNEGLAVNVSWRIAEGAGDFVYPRLANIWRYVTGELPGLSQTIPVLAKDDQLGLYHEVATAHLLQTRGRKALVKFFTLTQSGKPFDQAFAAAFGTTPEAFQTEFVKAVEARRAAASGK